MFFSVDQLIYFKNLFGKVYYQLLEHQEETKDERVALIRMERLYPFPSEEVATVLSTYPNAEVVWCQEEPRNMGAWPMMDEWLGGWIDGDLLG